jgi:N-sulfoglucosamine sulfohydrolase
MLAGRLCLCAIVPLLLPIPAEAAGPNVLLITSEDNGPELSCYGDAFARTPHLDRLAAEGARFERALVTTPSCSESRASILTGLYPHQNGQIGLATHKYRTFDGVPNVVARLKKHGYRTGIIGKLHVNPEAAFPFDYRPNVADSNTFARRDVRRVAELAGTFFTADDAPFMLMVNYADAHLPFLRQQHGLPAAPLGPDEVEPLAWIGLDAPRLRRATADYYNCIERMDAGVGMLLAELERSGLARNTLVIYLGDHGPQFPRGKNAAMYESSLRVPLIVRWPGRATAGEVYEQLVSSIDLVPTIYEAVGVESAVELPGRSLLPLVGSGSGGQGVPWRTYLYAEYHAHYPPLYFPQRAVRDRRYKLIVNLLQDRDSPMAESQCRRKQPSESIPSYLTAAELAAAPEAVRRAYDTWLDAPPLELYDLEADPHERDNRADDPALADVKAGLLAALCHWQRETADPLADAGKLARLTEEHDAVGMPYDRRNWEPEYHHYFAPKAMNAPAVPSRHDVDRSTP